MRAHVSSYRTVIQFTACDPVVVAIQTDFTVRPVPKILGLDWMCIGPQPNMGTSSNIFRSTIFLPLYGRLQTLKLLVVPRHPGLDLFEVNVFAARQPDRASEPTILVDAGTSEIYGFP